MWAVSTGSRSKSATGGTMETTWVARAKASRPRLSNAPAPSVSNTCAPMPKAAKAAALSSVRHVPLTTQAPPGYRASRSDAKARPEYPNPKINTCRGGGDEVCVRRQQHPRRRRTKNEVIDFEHQEIKSITMLI